MKQQVYAECDCPEFAGRLRERLLGIGPAIGRWVDPMNTAISDVNPCSVNFEIPDYQGPADLVLIRNIRGVKQADIIRDPISLPSFMETRRRYFVAA